MKIEVNYIFRDDQVDPIYHKLGLEMDADEVEIVERGVLDLSKVSGAAQFYESTQVFMDNGQVFYVDLQFEEFKYIWQTV